jgi:predicted PurR-regulated permease PerM
VLIRFALIAGIVYLAWRARLVLVTVFVSAVLALTLAPVVNSLSRPPMFGWTRKTRRTVAAALVFVALAAVLAGAYRLLVHPLVGETTRMVVSLQHETGHWQGAIASIQAFFNQLPPSVQEALKGLDLSGITNRAPRFLTGFLATGAQWAVVLIDIVLIPILAFYFILEGRGLTREFAGVIPAKWRRDAISITRATGRILRDYTVANLVLCLIAGVAVYIGLWLLDVPYALSLSVLAGVTRFVPVIGPIVGAIPILLLSLAQGVGVASAVLVFFIALHLVESKVLLPKLIGNRLHIHGAVVLIVLLLGGEFAGILGMFLAAPVAALLRVLLRTYLLRMRRRSASGLPQATRKPLSSKRPRPPKKSLEAAAAPVVTALPTEAE